MAFTSTQLAVLEEAYANGVTAVRMPDGRSVNYQTLNNLWEAIQQVKRQLATPKRRMASRAVCSTGLTVTPSESWDTD